MKKAEVLRLLFIILSIISIAYSIYIVLRDLIDFSNASELVISIIAILAVAISTAVVFYITGFLKRKIPLIYSVAIIGFPKSGKTTLLMNLFDAIMERKISSFKIKVEGSEIIEKVTKNISLLKNYQKLNATTDQTVFAYKTVIETKSIIGRKIYKVAFGDFPGEDSLDFAKKYGIWFHRTPYFRWVMDSNALIFVIDCGEYMIQKLSNNNDNYVSEITASFRAAWQHLIDLENNQHIKIDYRRMPIIVLFSKSDIFSHYHLSSYIIDYFNKIDSNKNNKLQIKIDYIKHVTYNIIPHSIDSKDLLGFTIPDDLISFLRLDENQINAYRTRNNREINPSLFNQISNSKLKIQKDFSGLISYFKDDNKNFNTLFYSSFGEIRDFKNQQIQYEQLLEYLLPK